MRRVCRVADEHVYIGSVLKKYACGKGCPVFLIAPIFKAAVILDVRLGVIQNAVNSYDALGDEVDALDVRYWRYVRVGRIVFCLYRRVQILRRDLRGCAAADYMLSLLGEEKSHHAVIVAYILRRADGNVDRLALADLDYARR